MFGKSSTDQPQQVLNLHWRDRDGRVHAALLESGLYRL